MSVSSSVFAPLSQPRFVGAAVGAAVGVMVGVAVGIAVRVTYIPVGICLSFCMGSLWEAGIPTPGFDPNPATVGSKKSLVKNEFYELAF